MNDILNHEDDIKIIFELMGYCLLKDNTFEKAFMFVGTGRNGKSKLLSLMKRFLGIENCASVPLSQLKPESSSICELHNRLVNLAGDLSNTDLKDTGMFKQLTGRDLITAKRKYLRDLIFENYSKLIFACNELPRVYDTNKGFWSRWILLEFPYQFIPNSEYEDLLDKDNKKIQNPSILDEISTPEEMSGLLNESLKGLDELTKNKKFSYSKGTAQIKDLWIRMSNSFMAFCLDCLEENSEGFITKEDLRKGFHNYCKKFNIKGAGDKDIKATLGDVFGVSEARKTIGNDVEYIWKGIIPKNDKMLGLSPYFPKLVYAYNRGILEKNPNNHNIKEEIFDIKEKFKGDLKNQ